MRPDRASRRHPGSRLLEITSPKGLKFFLGTPSLLPSFSAVCSGVRRPKTPGLSRARHVDNSARHHPHVELPTPTAGLCHSPAVCVRMLSAFSLAWSTLPLFLTRGGKSVHGYAAAFSGGSLLSGCRASSAVASTPWCRRASSRTAESRTGRPRYLEGNSALGAERARPLADHAPPIPPNLGGQLRPPSANAHASPISSRDGGGNFAGSNFTISH